MKIIKSKIDQIKEKIPEAKRIKLAKVLHIARTVKNTVCWVMLGILVVMVIMFLTARINGGTPSIFGYTLHRVETGSMEPVLHVGDVILNKDVNDISELSVGDIITFKGGRDVNDRIITHRIISIPEPNETGDNARLKTKGDANEVPDSEITMKAVESKFQTKIEFLRVFYEFFLSPWGLLIFIFLLLLIFIDELINIVRITSGYYENEEGEESISDIIDRIRREDYEKKKALSIKAESENADMPEKSEQTAKEEAVEEPVEDNTIVVSHENDG